MCFQESLIIIFMLNCLYIFAYRLPFLVESYYCEEVGFSVLLMYEILEIFVVFFSVPQ